MKYIELRKILENFSKYPGTKKVKPASVANKGFPGKFNISFSLQNFYPELGKSIDSVNEEILDALRRRS